MALVPQAQAARRVPSGRLNPQEKMQQPGGACQRLSCSVYCRCAIVVAGGPASSIADDAFKP